MIAAALCASPIAFDTLPAAKTRFFQGGPRCKIYTQARLYLCDDGLHLSLSAFEQTPPPESRVLFALCANGQLAGIHLAPTSAAFSLQGADATGPPLAAKPAQPLACRPFSGTDEQGWYWGAEITVPAQLLAPLGFSDTGDGPPATAALYKFDNGDEGFGCSVPIGPAPHPHTEFYEPVSYFPY